MKLITKNGQLDLSSDFSFEIVQNAPPFSNEGTQSIPTTLPVTDRNLQALSFPTRLGRVSKYTSKIPAKLDAGLFQKDGQLVIDTAQKKAGIVGSIMLNESDLYSQIKDVALKTVFEKIVRDDFAVESDPITAWYNYIISCMTGEKSDDFTCFPVAVNYNEADGYQFLNGPDHTSEIDPWPLKYKARRVAQDDTTINVPDGYGITPFLWLYRAIELLFADFDYTVRLNPFKDDSLLKKIVLINNNADTICPGKVKYSDLVPTCTVSEFMTFIENKFLMHFYVYAESKIIDLIPLQTILTSAHDLDLTEFINENPKYIFTERKEVDITSDISLEGAVPAKDTLLELAAKYNVLTELNEPDWRNNAWKYSLVLRRSTGEYYEILRRPSDSAVKRNRLGSNYFRHFEKTHTALSYSSADVLPPMVDVSLGLLGAQEANVLCPFIGVKNHINTAYKDEAIAEQKIIIAYAAARAEEDIIISAKYYFGTTQKYNNFGHSWCDYDLTTKDIYQLFFKGWNNVLRNSAIEVQCKVDYPLKSLMSLRLDKLKMINGQQALLKSLSYNVGSHISHNSSSFLITKLLTPLIADQVISFATQLYMWEYNNNGADVFAEFDTQQYDDYSFEYVGNDAPSKSTYEYIPPPTAEQYNAGGQYFYQENAIKITAKKIGDSTLWYYDRVLITWFEAVLI